MLEETRQKRLVVRPDARFYNAIVSEKICCSQSFLFCLTLSVAGSIPVYPTVIFFKWDISSVVEQ